MEKKKLNILWTQEDANVAHSMVFMYATNSLIKEWWDEVNVIIWGPSARLVANDEGVQEKIKMFKSHGGQITACLACANTYGVAEKLMDLEIEVIYYGQPLTDILQSDEKLITI